MPISQNLIPYREFSDGTPSGWLAGESQSVLEFIYTGTDWTSYFVSASSNYITLFDAATIPIVVGDSLRLTYADRTVVVSINRITNVGTAYTYQLYFKPSLSYSNIGIIGVERWVGRNDYIAVEFRASLYDFAFYTENIKCNKLGKASIDIGAAMRGFNKPQFLYDNAGQLNQLQPDANQNFVIIWNAIELGLPYSGLIPYKLHAVEAALQIQSPTSSNLIDYVPNPNVPTSAKWLTKMPKKRVYAGVPNFLSFIYSEFMTAATLNFGATTIPLDDTQDFGVHRILMDETWFAGEPCFTIGADPVPDPPPPTPPPKRRRELSFHFMNSRNKAAYTVIENIHWVRTESFLGIFSLGGAIFKINGSAYPSLAAWQLALLSTVIGDVLEIEITNQSAVNSYFTDQIFYLEYGTNDTTLYPFYRQHTIDFSSAKVGCDRMILVRHRLEFDPNPLSHSKMYIGIRKNPPNYENYTVFPYNLSDAADIAALNLALAAIPDGENFGLHFWYGWNGKFPAGTALTSGNADAGFKYRYLDAPYNDDYYIFGSTGENSYPLNIPELSGSSKVFDGISTYQRISSFPCQRLNNGSAFTIHLKFFCNNILNNGAYGERAIFATEWGGGGNGQRFEIIQAGAGYCAVLFAVGASQAFYWYAPLKNEWNTLVFSYDGRSDVTNGAGGKIIINGAENWVFGKSNPSVPTTGSWSCWDGSRSRATIGCMFHQSTGTFAYHNGTIQAVNIWTGAALPAPDSIEKRCFQTVGNYNGGVWNGETYDPTVLSNFWLKYNNFTGASVLTSSSPTSITNFGANIFQPFLI